MVTFNEQSGEASVNLKGQTHSLILESIGSDLQEAEKLQTTVLCHPGICNMEHVCFCCEDLILLGMATLLCGIYFLSIWFLVLSAFIVDPTITTVGSAQRKGHRTTIYILVWIWVSGLQLFKSMIEFYCCIFSYTNPRWFTSFQRECRQRSTVIEITGGFPILSQLLQISQNTTSAHHYLLIMLFIRLHSKSFIWNINKQAQTLLHFLKNIFW